jgi:tetratricopeptide (TPR) repeat protein
MPVSKKRRRTAMPGSSRKAVDAAIVPDRRAMESFLAAVAGRSRREAIEKAQDLIYDAWERATARSRIALARKALAITPLCADAYSILAEEARSVEETRDLYARGVEAGELALGRKGFKEYAGHFWGFLETRPYMRARAGLASALLKLGDDEAAISHYCDMLELNPGDNQGIRYVLLGCLLRRGDEAALKELLAAYEDEGSAHWLYTRALLAFREGRVSENEVVRLVKSARSANEHVPGILAGTASPVVSDNDYITVGGADEATEYVAECGPAWHGTPGAVEWLTKIIAAMSANDP